MTTNEKTSTDRMAARVERGERKMATDGKESKMKITASNLIRWAGLSAMVAGIIFVVIQPIHPLDVLSSVTTTQWAIIQSLKTAMCLFGLLGLAGLYARQVNEAGWLGLAGYLLFSLFFAHTIAFAFTEAFILPQLATEAPKFVESFLGIFNGHPGEMNLGALPSALCDSRVWVCARRPAVWHRDVPRRHPAALGGRSACRRGRVALLSCLRSSRTRSIGHSRCRWG